MDSGNQTLRKLSASGTNWVVSTVAGLSGTAGYADGTGTAAEFYFPAGGALDGAGRLYLADSGNNVIRMTWVVRAPAAILRRGESTGACLACVSSRLRSGDRRHAGSRRAVDAAYEWNRDGGEQSGPHQRPGRHISVLPAPQAIAFAS